MKILDTVWMVVCPPNNDGVIYAVSQSASSVWEDIERREVMGTGMTAAMLKKKGYRAMKVQIVLPDGMKEIVDQIDTAIEAAKSVQAEQGPDKYRRAAEVELAEERAKLILMIEGRATK